MEGENLLCQSDLEISVHQGADEAFNTNSLKTKASLLVQGSHGSLKSLKVLKFEKLKLSP